MVWVFRSHFRNLIRRIYINFERMQPFTSKNMSQSTTNYYLLPNDTFKWDENNYFDRKDNLFRTLKLSFFGHTEDTQDAVTYVVTLVSSKIVKILILSRHLITEINQSCAKFAISYRPKAKCHITARLEKKIYHVI